MNGSLVLFDVQMAKRQNYEDASKFKGKVQTGTPVLVGATRLLKETKMPNTKWLLKRSEAEIYLIIAF